MLVEQDGTKASLRFHLSEVSGVSGGSLSCLVATARPSQSAHDSLALLAGRRDLLHMQKVPRAGPPGSATRSTCQAAKLHLPGPLHGHTVPARHPLSMCPARPWATYEHPLTSFQPPACPWTVTSAPPDGEPAPPGPDSAGLSCLSVVPLLVGPNHESMVDGPLTRRTPDPYPEW